MARNEIQKGKFVVQYRPNAKGNSGKRIQPISLKMKKYKGKEEHKVLAFWESQYDKFLNCKDTSSFVGKMAIGSEKEKQYRRCLTKVNPTSEKYCKVLAKGNYSVGGITASNPVVLEFKNWKINPETGKKVKLPSTFFKGQLLTKGKTGTIENSTCSMEEMTKYSP